MTAWDDITKIYVMFGVILAIAFPAFIWMLARMKIHEAIKFGEEQGPDDAPVAGVFMPRETSLRWFADLRGRA